MMEVAAATFKASTMAAPTMVLMLQWTSLWALRRLHDTRVVEAA